MPNAPQATDFTVHGDLPDLSGLTLLVLRCVGGEREAWKRTPVGVALGWESLRIILVAEGFRELTITPERITTERRETTASGELEWFEVQLLPFGTQSYLVRHGFVQPPAHLWSRPLPRPIAVGEWARPEIPPESAHAMCSGIGAEVLAIHDGDGPATRCTVRLYDGKTITLQQALLKPCSLLDALEDVADRVQLGEEPGSYVVISGGQRYPMQEADAKALLRASARAGGRCPLIAHYATNLGAAGWRYSFDQALAPITIHRLMHQPALLEQLSPAAALAALRVARIRAQELPPDVELGLRSRAGEPESLW